MQTKLLTIDNEKNSVPAAWVGMTHLQLLAEGKTIQYPAVPDSTLQYRPIGKTDQKVFLHPERYYYPET